MNNDINNKEHETQSQLDIHNDIDNSYLNYKNTNTQLLIKKIPVKATKEFSISSFINRAITITSIISFGSLFIFNSIHILGATKDFNAKVKSNFKEQDMFFSSFNNNTEKLKDINQVTLLQTKNFLNDNYDSLLDGLSLKLKDDISYYRSKGMHPIDTYNSIILTPTITNIEKNQNELSGIENNAYLKKLGEYFNIFSYENEIKSYSNSANTTSVLNVLDKNIRVNQLASKNCAITLKSDKDGYFLKIKPPNFMNDIYKNLNDVENISTEIKYNEVEQGFLQEFIFLHEYTHCLIFSGMFEPKFEERLFGSSSDPQILNHSSYVTHTPSLLLSSNKHTLLSNKNYGYLHVKPKILTQAEERLADIFAVTMLLHRYIDADPESLISLNKVISQLYIMRLQTQLLSPFDSHTGHEIFTHLSQPETLSKIKQLKTFDEIRDFSLQTYEMSNDWRLFHTPGFLQSHINLEFIIREFEKIMIYNLLENSSDKQKFDNAFYFTENKPSVYKELTAISSDYIFEYYKNHPNTVLEQIRGNLLEDSNEGFFFTKFFEEHYTKYFDIKSSKPISDKITEFEQTLKKNTTLDKSSILMLSSLVQLKHQLNFQSDEIVNNIEARLEHFEVANKQMGYFYNSTYVLYQLSEEKTVNFLFPDTKPVYYENFLSSVSSFLNNKPLKIVKQTTLDDTIKLKKLFGEAVFENEKLENPLIPDVDLKIEQNIQIMNILQNKTKTKHLKFKR